MVDAVRLAPEHVMCRTLGHAWDDYVDTDLKRPSWGVRMSWRCVRCDMRRHDVIDSLGELSVRAYEAPYGYSLTRDEKPTVQQLRLTLKRQLRRKEVEVTHKSRRLRAVS
jgi:hypothetical protein